MDNEDFWNSIPDKQPDIPMRNPKKAEQKTSMTQDEQSFWASEPSKKQEDPNQEEYDISKYDKLFTPQKIARRLSRVGEALLGAPRNIEEAAAEVVAYPFEKSTGTPWPKLRKAISGKDNDLIGGRLPSTRELKDISEKATQGYTAPQNQWEEREDNILTTTTSLLHPLLRAGMTIPRAVGSSLGANVLAEVGKKAGISESSQNTLEGTALFLMSLGRSPGVNNYKNAIYQQAENAISRDATIDANRIVNSLNNQRHNLSRGTMAPSERFAVNEIDEILNKVQNGRIRVDELWASKRSLNEKVQNTYTSPDVGSNRRIRRNADSIRNDLNQGLREYGAENPNFYHYFTEAEQAHMAIENSRRVSRYIENHGSKYLKHTATGALFGVGAGHGSLAGKALAGAAATRLGLAATELTYRVSRSPVLRRYYSCVINAAMEENSAAFAKNMNKLDSNIMKDDEIKKLMESLGYKD